MPRLTRPALHFPARLVSAALLGELRTKLRQEGLVAWIDPRGIWRDLIGGITAHPESLGHPLVTFTGSWLGWLEALGERPEGRDPTPLLLYLPGLDDAALRESPAFPVVQMEHIHTVLGMGPAWRSFCASLRGPTRAEAADGSDAVKVLRDRVTDDLVAWILSVEYVRDLQREPRLPELAPLRALPESLAARCQGLAVHLRHHHAERYASLADEVELLLRDGELYDLHADDLGQIDTFRCEERCVLADAVRALQGSRWQAVAGLADVRLEPGRSFWLAQVGADWSRLRRWTWTLVRQAAALGAALADAAEYGELRTMGLGECAEFYASRLAGADRAHRTFEQRLAELLDPRMEHYGALQEVAARLRGLYRAWADRLARAFSARCRDRGFLPDASYQQRTLYEQVVQPLVEHGRKVALFLVDAFRFEMATELVELLKHDERSLHLTPRLAELPTLTAVGMNALVPVAQNGKLRVAGEFEGFRAGEFTVSRPDDRARAVGQRSLGKTKALLLDLATVCGPTPGKDLAKQVALR